MYMLSVPYLQYQAFVFPALAFMDLITFLGLTHQLSAHHLTSSCILTLILLHVSDLSACFK